MPFIWGYKSHRISKAQLHKPTKKGGLGLPVLKHYYWVANSRALTYWSNFVAEPESGPSWLRLQAFAAKNSSLSVLLFSSTCLIDKSIQQNFISENSLQILNQIKMAHHIQSVSAHAPICQNHTFKPGLCDGVFAVWREKDIRIFQDLYTDGHLASSVNEVLGSVSPPHIF